MTLAELEAELGPMRSTINRILKQCQFLDYGDLSGLDLDYKDPEQVFLRNEYSVIMEHLADISAELAILNSPVKYTGTLRLRPDGRYGTEDGFYYTSGSPIEALLDDPNSGDPAQWVLSTIEYAEDYYIVGHRGIKLNGLTVRRRANPITGF